MKSRARMLIPAILLLATACSSYQPVVDLKASKDAKTFQESVMECKYLANQEISVAGDAAWGATIGIITSAALGTIIAVVTKSPEPLLLVVGVGAAGGALGGGGMGAIKAQDERNSMVRACLKGRGFSVLR